MSLAVLREVRGNWVTRTAVKVTSEIGITIDIPKFFLNQFGRPKTVTMIRDCGITEQYRAGFKGSNDFRV